MSERKELPGEIVAVACMDEALSFGPSVYVAGVGGSGVTRLESGNQTFFPDERRRLVERFRPILYRSLGTVADQLGVGIAITSHVGCGWAGAQGIESQSLAQSTRAMAGTLGWEYIGQIPYADRPVELGKPGVFASVERAPSDHNHDAEAIVLTVGGFITQAEKERIRKDHGKPFILSADWLADVVTSGETIQDGLDFLELEVDIARGIARGVSTQGSLRIFDAGRLEYLKAVRNRAFVRQLFQRFPLSDNSEWL